MKGFNLRSINILEIICGLLSESRSQTKQTNFSPDTSSSSSRLPLPEAFQGQTGYVIPPVCSGSAWGIYSQVDWSRIQNQFNRLFHYIFALFNGFSPSFILPHIVQCRPFYETLQSNLQLVLQSATKSMYYTS